MNIIEKLEELKTVSFEEGEKQLIALHQEAQKMYEFTSKVMIYETIFFDEKSKPQLQKKYLEEVENVIEEVKIHTQ